jgi:NAD(P) transhydrogenase subunit alpha
MLIFVPKETDPRETRVPIVPPTVSKLVRLGAVVEIEKDLGKAIGHPDADYEETGATISSDPAESASVADLVLRLRPPAGDFIQQLKTGAIHISYLDPFNRHDLVRDLTGAGISAISMEMIPRTTLAQKMDALSSQANLAGYAAVALAAERLDRIFPMMMTPAGTIAPARVFVIGVGVAGLQAIATAKRLGARVEAFDTRPVVEEQVKSLGARFVKIDLGETGQTEQGYAKALTPEQLEKQRAGIAQHCAGADVVITAAQVFGRRAPVIVTSDMVKQMKPGSIVVDLAAETGGNVEGLVLDEETMVDGVRVVGYTNMAGRMAINASEMYSANLYNLIEHFWDKENKTLKLDLSDEIMLGCLITHESRIVNDAIRKLIEGEQL